MVNAEGLARVGGFDESPGIACRTGAGYNVPTIFNCRGSVGPKSCCTIAYTRVN